ncbi:MAG: ABC transporter permease [Firmicutes bacterium]|nr:ABC transporter permease [Bacillota bacterium]
MLALAWNNVRRYAGQMLLAVAAVTCAAALLTAALTLREGFPAGFDRALRAYVGGDVILWPGLLPRFGAGEEGGAAALAWAPAPPEGAATLPLFWPEVAEAGLYLTARPLSPAAVDPARPVRKAVTSAGLAVLYPRLALPARLGDAAVVLVPRFPGQMDAAAWQALNAPPPPSGWADEAAGDALDAYLPAGLAAGDGRLLVPRSGAGSGPGGAAAAATVSWDWRNPLAVPVKVRGTYVLELPPLLPVHDPAGRPLATERGPVSAYPVWPAREVFVPWPQWLGLWQRAAGGAWPPAWEWDVRVADTAKAQAAAAELAAPGAATAAAVHELWSNRRSDAYIVQRGDAAAAAPAGGAPSPAPAGTAGGLRTQWYGRGLPGLVRVPAALWWGVLVTAVLILVGQSILLQGARRRQLLILHAIGAGAGQLAALLLSEVLLYSLLGAVTGWALTTLLMLPAVLPGRATAAWFAAQAARLGIVALAAAVAGVAAALPVTLLQLRRIDAAALQEE